jgi:glutamate N-acetyltransferase/amino-acid N-acetyltransferase
VFTAIEKGGNWLSPQAISGSITVPRGFEAAGVSCGIKNRKRDLALIYSEVPATAAAVYTANQFKAAPLWLTQRHLADGKAQAIVCNSGYANACTGERGKEDALRMAQLIAQELKIPPEMVVVASTGVIGRYLPIRRIEKGIPELASLLGDDDNGAAEAILTTDTVPKKVAVAVELANSTIRIGGIAKGSGMICPNMATMLAFLTTDARIGPELLQRLLRDSVDKSFNMITIDGDTSTNDMAVILANGLSGGAEITEGSGDCVSLAAALDFVTGELAKMIAKDGEGATKLVAISVEGAGSFPEAKQVAFAVANSALVKTALFGQDPNWGRIAAAVGTSGVEVKEEKLAISIGNLMVCNNGVGADFSMRKARQLLSAPEVEITINLNQGRQQARVYTCDLSCDSVKINAKYTT